MDPAIEHSLIQTSEHKWLVGSSMICESGLPTPPNNALASWASEDGVSYHLRHKQPKECVDITEDEIRHGAQLGRIHQGGTSAAVWAFGGVHIKVKAWISDIQLESDTIAYVREVSDIPVPQVIFSTVDEAWNRSFLILRSIEGRTLYQAWNSLSLNQMEFIADQIASFCAELAGSSSSRLETISGKGVFEPWLTRKPAPSEPSWKPNLIGPFSADQLKAYTHNAVLPIEPEFSFYHADLGPTNVLVNDEGQVVAILDWESAAFYPRFWIATKPLFSAGFNLQAPHRSEWAFLLSGALERKGFTSDADACRTWQAALKE